MNYYIPFEKPIKEKWGHYKVTLELDSNVSLLMNIKRNDLRVLESERLFQGIIASTWIRRQQSIFAFVKLLKTTDIFVMGLSVHSSVIQKKSAPSRRIVVEFYIEDVFYNLSSGLKFVWNRDNMYGTWPVLWLQVEQTASKCAAKLPIYWISSCRKPTRGGPPARGLDGGLTTFHTKNLTF
jgi:hypothetical protein